jgi:hypothetical protein
MNQLQTLWEKTVGFLAFYDTQKLTEALYDLNWQEVLHNPLIWVTAIPLLGYLTWKRHFHFLLLMFSLVLLMVLILNTLPPAGEPIPLNKILTFIGGSVALVALNLYFLVVRG